MKIKENTIHNGIEFLKLSEARSLHIYVILALSFLAMYALSSCGDYSSGNGADADDGPRKTLQIVQDRDLLNCGVNQGLEGFASLDSLGAWNGIDTDFCRSIAAAVLGDKDKVNFVPIAGKERFTSLASGEIDVLSRNTTWTFVRDTGLGLNFVGVLYYDGQGFMVRKKSGIQDLKELDGATVCALAGTTTELNASDYFRRNNLRYTLVTFDSSAQTLEGFEAGRCDVLTSDLSQLSGLKVKMADPASVLLLDGVISKEPLSPLVRQGDDQWFNIVKWTLNALKAAEEFNLTSANVEAALSNPSIAPESRRLLGLEGEGGETIGLEKNWAYQIISQVGNYGEIFERNVGEASPLGIARGVNSQWYNGGLIYAMPFR